VKPRGLQVIVCAALLLSGVAGAQVRRTGPPGGWAISVGADPTSETIYAAWHGAGIIRSDNGGRTWIEINHGLSELTVVAIAIDPQHPTRIYAGTENGVFKSIDRGANWFATNEGLKTRDVWAIAVDPADSATLYLGTAGGGIYKSADEGKSWSLVTKNLNAVVTSLVIVPGKPEAVYAGTLTAGMVRSLDGGKSWAGKTEGIGRRVFALAVNPLHPELLYAGTASGLFQTTDRGETWNECLGKQQPVFSVALEGKTGNKLFAGTGDGVLLSRDGGRHWKGPDLPMRGQISWALTLARTRPDWVFAGTLGGGVFASRDGGDHWSSIKADAPNQIVYTILAHPQEKDVLYASTAGDGIFKTSDGGKKWLRINEGLENHVVKALVLDPHNTDVMYAGTQKQFLTKGGAVFKSVTAGQSWTRITEQDRRIFSLAIDPHDPRRVYAGTDDGKVLRSADSGATWTEALIRSGTIEQTTSQAQQAMHPQPVFAIEFDLEKAEVVYAGTDAGVMKSGDGGLTWTACNEGLSDLRVRSMVVDVHHGGAIYLGTGDEEHLGAVFKSVDGCRSWSQTQLQNHWILALTADARTGHIYAGTESGVYESADGGTSWQQLPGADAIRYVLSVAVDPFRPGQVYVGTEGKSVFVLINNNGPVAGR